MSDGILKVIADLQSDEDLTSLSEANVSQSVVLRILDALSWNTYDHREVSPEHPVEARWVDYALLIGNALQVFIEVKKGGEPLEKHRKQLLDYAFRQGVKVAILTNGLTWWFYLPLREGDWQQRKFDTLELGKQDKGEIAQKLVDFLDKENVSSGKAVQNAEDLYKKRQISATLPEAWNQLVSEAEDLIINLLVEKTRELCGHKPQEKEVKKFLSVHFQTIQITQPSMDRKPDPPPKRNPSCSMTGKKPTAFTFNGTKYDELKSWKEMLVKFCETVHNDQGSRFEEVLRFRGRKRPDFSRNPDDLRKAEMINETGIYVEANRSAEGAKKLANKLIAHFGYNENALHIDAQ